ncbi:MAG: glycoside hydrolase family 44 protein [Rhizomicrobium sp.]
MPLAGWVAKLGNNRSILPAFSVNKYGSQCDVDPYDTDAGDGILPDCSTFITGNDPNDAYIKDSTGLEQKWLQHLTKTWGKSKSGGVEYYLMDNEPSIWFSTHRDIHPIGPHADEYRDKVIAESAAIKKLDPNAQVIATRGMGLGGLFLFRLRPAIRGPRTAIAAGPTMTGFRAGWTTSPGCSASGRPPAIRSTS